MYLKILSAKWRPFCPGEDELFHWGRVTHISIGNLTIIGSDNGLSPGRRQAIIWTNVRILLIGPLGTNFSEMLIKINTFSFKKIHLKMSSGCVKCLLSLQPTQNTVLGDRPWATSGYRRCMPDGPWVKINILSYHSSDHCISTIGISKLKHQTSSWYFVS